MKTSQIILLIAILFSTCNIFAQQKNDFIKLEDIVVFGKSHGLNDSLKVTKEDYSLTGINDISKFAYEPYLKTYSIKKQLVLPKANEQAVLHLMAGSKSLVRSHLAYHSPKSELLRFSADYDQDIYQSDWQNSSLSLYWLSQVTKYHTILSYYQRKYQIPEANTEFSGGKAILPDWQIDLSHYGTGNITGEIAYTQFEQKDNFNDPVSQKDFDANILMNWYNNDLNGGISADYLIDTFQMRSWIQKENWWLDQAGLWIALDPDQISASFKYCHSISLGKDFSLLLSNKPYLGRYDRKSLLENNHYLDLSPDIKQENVPLNHTICWQYEGKIFASIALNNRYILNQMNYTMIEHPDEWVDVFYEPEYLNNWENEISARLCWQWNNISFDHQAEYTIYENNINFTPAFSLNNDLNYTYQKLTTTLDLIYNTGRCDQDNNYMKDALLLNIGLQYKLLNNLNLTAKVENVANNKYQKFLLSPKRSIVVLGGFELNF